MSCFVRTNVRIFVTHKHTKAEQMYNTTKILKGLLEKTNVETDSTLGIASIEVEDTKFYLHAILTLDSSGYETDYTLALKTSEDVSHTTLEFMEMEEEHEEQISEYLLQFFTDEEKDVTEWPFNHAEEYAINNNQFINLNN